MEIYITLQTGLTDQRHMKLTANISKLHLAEPIFSTFTQSVKFQTCFYSKNHFFFENESLGRGKGMKMNNVIPNIHIIELTVSPESPSKFGRRLEG